MDNEKIQKLAEEMSEKEFERIGNRIYGNKSVPDDEAVAYFLKARPGISIEEAQRKVEFWKLEFGQMEADLERDRQIDKYIGGQRDDD